MISPALPLSPKPRPSAAPGGDRDDVLEGAAQLHADDVGVHVEPEAPRPDPGLNAPRERLVLGADDGRRGQPAGNLGGEVRPRQRGDAATSMPGRLADDLAHPQERTRLEPLDEREDVGVARQMRRHPADRLAEMRGWDRDDDEIGLRERMRRPRSPSGRAES